uniref:Uncharacterized protein n=1 Tax=Anabas testudineus TaxID=64144 RepID=A0A7N6FH15_ANATE
GDSIIFALRVSQNKSKKYSIKKDTQIDLMVKLSLSLSLFQFLSLSVWLSVSHTHRHTQYRLNTLRYINPSPNFHSPPIWSTAVSLSL